MMKILTVALLLLALLACDRNAQSKDKEKQRIDEVCDSFMKLFSEGRNAEALQLLKQNTVMTPASIDTLHETINTQMRQYSPAYGKMLKSEFILERKINDIIAKRFYLLKFDKYYLKFDFTLYQGSGGWIITHFKYDDELLELLY